MGQSSSSTEDFTLTDSDLDFLVKTTGYGKNDIIDWYKGFQRDCPDGRLSKEKFTRTYKMYCHTASEKFASHVFRIFDTDGNGKIDFKEFLIAIAITSGSDANEKLKWAFRMYDINGDGFIELKEMSKIIKAFYEMMDCSKIEQKAVSQTEKIFEKLDLNKDGKISLEEFLNVCNEDPQLAKIISFK